jgi:hypothetical protein
MCSPSASGAIWGASRLVDDFINVIGQKQTSLHERNTRRKVGGIEVVSLFGLLFWLMKGASSSFCQNAHSKPCPMLRWVDASLIEADANKRRLLQQNLPTRDLVV